MIRSQPREDLRKFSRFSLSTSTTISSGRKRRPWLLFGFFFCFWHFVLVVAIWYGWSWCLRTDGAGSLHPRHTRPWFVVFLKRRHPPSDRIERGYRITSECDGLQNEQRRWSGFEVWKGLVVLDGCTRTTGSVLPAASLPLPVCKCNDNHQILMGQNRRRQRHRETL